MQKIKYLEGLRGVAALIVLLAHLSLTSFINEQQLLNSNINELEIHNLFKHFLTDTVVILLDGELAVWIFWVLSSYVISIIFFKKEEDYDKVLIGYFSKRYFRLFIPVFFSVILAYLLLKFGLMFNNELATTNGSPYLGGWLNSFYNFEPNLFKAFKSSVYQTFFNFQYDTTYNAVLWTIQNEFLGSLFTFGIFGIIRHNSRRYILYFIISLVLIKLKILWLLAFVIGHILCDYDFSTTNNKFLNNLKKTENEFHKYKISIFLFSIIFIILGYRIMSFIKIPEDYHKLILSVSIVYMCLKNEYYKAIFSSKIPFWLGKISFSLYLIHLPIICSLTSYLILTNNNLQGKIFASLITILVVLIISLFFTKYIDKKSVDYANKIGDYFKKYS